ANVCDIKVEVDQKVAAGDPVVVLEAMKMQTPIASEVAGTVIAISTKIGQALQPGDKLIKINSGED
ncbi:MAG: pyruvate carboxylase subunit B, partial [Desulfobulbaceae bacterium]|nr:pyruvate carboxylase subunit B [Desulfobulbaceae bacterium]